MFTIWNGISFLAIVSKDPDTYLNQFKMASAVQDGGRKSQEHHFGVSQHF
jgi:hypothetical protein